MKTVLNLKIEKETKQQAAKLAERMGLTLSAVVNGFLHHYIQTQELHITAAPRMTPYLEKVIEKARKDYKDGKDVSPVFDNTKDAMRWLKSERK